MIASLAELNKVKDEYYRWWTHTQKDCQLRADAIAAENFAWVLDVAIEAVEKGGA